MNVPAFFLIGLDLGQAKDPSALAILEQTRPAPEAEAKYAVRDLRRWPLGTPYPEIVADVIQLVARPELAGKCELAIDGTGCGRPVVDQFRASAITCGVAPVLITAGHGHRFDEETRYWHVAKVELVSVMRVLVGMVRLRFIRKLPLTSTLERELETFTAKITQAGNETFAADWRQQAHDDIVLATAIAAWIGENVHVGPFEVTTDKDGSIMNDVPEGVFATDGMRRREADMSWPW